MKKILATAALMIAATTAAYAGTYGEVSTGQYQLRTGGLTLSQTLVRGIVGTDVAKNVAVEAHLATGVGSTTGSAGGLSASIPNTGVNYSVGLFAKASVPVTDQFAVFGRVGVTQTSLKLVGDNFSDTNGAVGVGASYAFSKNVAATVDYTRYTKIDGVRPTAIVAGVNYKF